MPNSIYASSRRVSAFYKVLCIGITCIMVGCAAPLPTAMQTPTPDQKPIDAASTAPLQAKAPSTAVPPATPDVLKVENISLAPNDKDYRQDAAKHLYAKNSQRIYPGKMPPLLYAIGVLEVDIDSLGFVTDLRWMRAPSHAPEVVAEIERSVRAAAPFPAPSHVSKVTYTDTWLWHKSGRFQLDTLTLGQW